MLLDGIQEEEFTAVKMKNKTILFALVLVCLAGVVSAIDEGQILTQAQIDNMNFDTANLQCRFDGLQTRLLDGRFEFDFSCLSLEISGARYKVIRQNIAEYFTIREYLDCRKTGTRIECILSVRDAVLYFFRSDRLSLRTWLKEFQTKSPDISEGDLEWGDLN